MDEEDYMINYAGDASRRNNDNQEPEILKNNNDTFDDPLASSISSHDPTESSNPALQLDPTAVVTTNRRIQVKLTAERMLSDRGLPHLMTTAKKRLHISKRKTAHENLSNIVRIYQLWAHELFPKAKFKDFIKLSNNLGQKDRILREYRKNIIKKEMGILIDGNDMDLHLEDVNNENENGNNTNENVENSANSNNTTIRVNNADDDIDEDTLINSSIVHGQDTTPDRVREKRQKNIFVEDDEEDDELYSLSSLNPRTVATESSIGTGINISATTSEKQLNRDQTAQVNDDLDREIQALENEQLMNNIPSTDNRSNNNEEGEFEEDEDAMNEMRELGL